MNQIRLGTFAVWIVALAISSAARASAMNGISFVKVADTTTQIPAGQWAGQNFGWFSSSGVNWPPAIDKGQIVFLGSYPSSHINGAFTWSAGTGIRLLADPSVPIPERGGANFSQIRYPSVDGGEFAFSSFDGIYRTVGGKLTKVIDPATIAPPSSATVGGSSAPSLDGNNTWFFGELSDPPFTEAIYRHRDAGLEVVAQDGMPAPLLPGNTMFELNSNVSGAAGKVAFAGASAGAQFVRGIYLYDGAVVERVADTTMTAPGAGGAKFSSLFNFPISTDGESVGFAGYVGSHTGVYLLRTGALEAVAVSGQPAPGGGTFPPFGQNAGVSVDSGRVAISLGNTIYTDYFGSLTRILGAGDTLFGQTVTSLSIGTEGLSGHQIAFLATLGDGRSGIFVANLPEPGSAVAMVVAAAAMTIMRRCRGRISTRRGSWAVVAASSRVGEIS